MRRTLQVAQAFLWRDLRGASLPDFCVEWAKGVVFLAVWAFVAHLFGRTRLRLGAGVEADYLAYTLVGIVMAQCGLRTVNQLLNRIRNQHRAGLTALLEGRPFQTPVLLLASSAWALLGSAANAAVLLAVGRALFGAKLAAGQIAGAVGLVLLLGLPMACLGILLASLEIGYGMRSNFAGQILNQFVMLANGILFPIAVFPLWIRGVALASPVTHAVVLSRTLGLPGGVYSAGSAWVGFGATAAGICLIAWAGSGLAWARLHRHGPVPR